MNWGQLFTNTKIIYVVNVRSAIEFNTVDARLHITDESVSSASISDTAFTLQLWNV
jgi:hypothetical protein